MSSGALGGIRSRARFLFAVLMAGLAGLVASVALGGPPSADAQAAGPPSVTKITSETNYTGVTITFSEPVYTQYTSVGGGATPPPATANGDLTAADFRLVDATGATIASPSAVDKVDSTLAVWKLTFGSAFIPNESFVKVTAGDIVDSEGVPNTEISTAAPLNQDRLTELLTGFKATQLPLDYKFGNGTTADLTDDYQVSDLPFIGDYLASTADVATVLDGASAITSVDSQSGLAAALEGLDGVGSVGFDNNGMTVGFTHDTTSPPEITMGGEIGIDELGLSVGSISAKASVTFNGSLTYDTTGSGAQIDTTKDSVTAKVNAAGNLTNLSADLGFAEATIPSSTLSFVPSMVLNLTCAPTSGTSCAPNALVAAEPTLSGTGSWDLESLSVLSGLGTTPFQPTGGVLGVDFTITNDFDAPTGFMTLDKTGFQSVGLDGFNRVSMTSILSGLGWLSTWLSELEQHGAMGSELPLIGGSVGELSAISGELSEAISSFSDDIGAYATKDANADGEPDHPNISAQQAVELLCESGLSGSATCKDLLAPFELVVDATTGKLTSIEYAIEVGLQNKFFDATHSPVLDLGFEDTDLEGISLNMDPGGWTGTASSSFKFKLGIKTEDAATLETALDMEPGVDYDGDDEPNASDWDADGDGLDDATGDSLTDPANDSPENEGADRDDDADGMPEDYSLADGDLCRGLYSVLDEPDESFTLQTFATANAVWTTDVAPDKPGDQGEVKYVECDALVKSGRSLSVKGSSLTLTSDQVCSAAAFVHGLSKTDFIAANNYTGASACATDIEGAKDTDTFSYDATVAFGSPITIGHRIYVDTGELAAVQMDVTGAGLDVAANLGFLDLAISSIDTIDGKYGVKLDPKFSLKLTDPGTGAVDSKIDLMEMAEAADTDSLVDLVDFDVSGQIQAHFDLENGILDKKQLDVIGDLTALDNAGTTAEPIFNFVSTRLETPTSTGVDADRINVGHNLGDYLNLKDLTAADVIQIIVNMAEKVSQMAGDEVMATEVPFTGTTLADAVQFSKTFADMAVGIQAADPQSLTAFEDALSSSLRAAGMPGAITPTVTGDSLSFTFNASRQVSAVYPFSLDPSDYGLPEGIPLLPSDGGASIEMTAGMNFTPEVGILYDGNAIKDRIFVRNFIPKFTASLAGIVHGTINIGPFATSLDGSLNIGQPGADDKWGTADDSPADITVTMADPTSGTPMTIEDLEVVLANLKSKSSVAVNGEFDADLSVSQPRGTITASGTLSDLFKRDFTAPTSIETDFEVDWSAIELSLDTFVTGATQTARWVGNLMEQSESYSAEIPLVGDKLQGLANAGKAVRALADTVDEAWNSANEEAEAFKTKLEEDMEDAIEGAFSGLPANALTVDAEAIWTERDGTYDVDDEITRFGAAGGLLVKVGVNLKDTKSVELPGGLNVPPVLEVEAGFSPSVTYGFGMNLGLGISIDDGFYVVGEDDGDLLEAFAKLNAAVNVNKVAIGGADIAKIVGGSAVIGGDIGPDGDAAGFEVEIVPAPDAEDGDIPKVTLADIVGKKKRADAPVDARFSIDAKIDLPLKTAFADIPNLSLPIHFKWDASGSVAGGAQIGKPALAIGSGNDDGDDQIELDAKDFLKNVIAPTLDKANDYNPFSKVPMIKNTIDSNIPVLESSMRKIARQFMGDHPAWTMFEFLLDMDQMATDVRTAADKLALANSGIKLGWVEVTGDYNGDQISGSGRHPYPEAWYDQAGFGPLVTALENLIGKAGGGGSLKRTNTTTMPATPSGGKTTVSTADMNTTNPVPNVTAQPDSKTGPCPTTAKPPAPAGTTASPRVGRNIGKFGCLFSFPIMDDPMAAIGMVLKGDFSETVSFVEFRPPPINVGPSIAWQRTLFDLDIAIVKGSLTVGFDGALGLTVRLGFGFDSSGLQKGRFPLDGFYLIDFKDPDTGRDLNEVDVGGRVAGFIDGKFSIAGDVASAHFTGAAGVNATAGLDFNDESEAILPEDRGDGRYHFREIIQVAKAGYDSSTDPTTKALRMLLCPVRPTADLSAFLSLRGRARVFGITVFDESYSNNWDLLSLLGIPKTINCPPPDRIAQVVDGQLVLNGGPNAANRLNGGTDIAEGFTVSQSGDNVTVTWSGTGSMSPSVLTFNMKDSERSFTEIVADLGASNDTVSINDNVTIPITVNGGPGDDTFTGGGGADTFDGGPGADILSGGAGDDILLGGTGNDTLTGGTGNDDLQGGDSTAETSNDTYNFTDSWGNDVVDDPDGYEKFVFSTSAKLTGTSEFADALITDDTNSVSYYVDEIDEIVSGSGNDEYTVKSQVPNGFLLKGGAGGDTVNVEYMGQERTITLQGDAGTDTFNAIGTAGPDTFMSRTTTLGDGTGTKGFVAVVADTAPADTTYNPNDDYVDRVNYGGTFEQLNIEAEAGKDQVVMDDNVVPTNVDGGTGRDRFQVGQIFGKARNVADGKLAAADIMSTQLTTRGHLSKGISAATTINGEAGNDFFQVYGNQAALKLNGNENNDTFIIRAFVLDDSDETDPETTIDAAIDAKGGASNDKFDYVANEQVDVDGGTGYDTFVVVGTEYGDGFIIDNAGIKICPVSIVAGVALPDTTAGCAIKSSYTNVEQVVGQGLEGNDVFHVLSTTNKASTELFGGKHSDRFIVGNAGDVTKIQGPLTVRGEEDPSFDDDVAPPIVLAKENYEGALPADTTMGTDVGDALVVDASTHTTADTGTIEFDPAAGDDDGIGSVQGLGIWTGGEIAGDEPEPDEDELEEGDAVDAGVYPDTFGAGVVYTELEFAVVQLGSGNDNFTVESTHAGMTTVRGGEGGDALNVQTIDGITRVRGEAGADTVRAGSNAPAANGDVDALAALLDVFGGDGADALYVDESAETEAQALDSDQVNEPSADPLTDMPDLALDAITPAAGSDVARGKLHVTGQADAGIHYDGLSLVDVTLAGGNDVVNVRGTTTKTVVHTVAGDERFYVSSAADQSTSDAALDHLNGDMDDVDGDLEIDPGSGRHLMLVSDEDATAGDGSIRIDENEVDGMGGEGLTAAEDAVAGVGGDINYLSGGNFADGITVWTSQGADTATFEGARLDTGFRTVTTLNTNGGADAVTADLSSTSDGAPVINLEGGTDTLAASASSADLIAFGGPGDDTMTTGTGKDTVFGDEGLIKYKDVSGSEVTVHGHGGAGDKTAGAEHPVASMNTRETATTSVTGGSDVITTGDSDDVVIGGDLGDTLSTGTGADLVVGDRATIDHQTYSARRSEISSTHGQVSPGADTITAGSGDNIVLGGGAADTVSSGAGLDLILGDEGEITYQSGSTRPADVTSTDSGATGGNDTIDAAGGHNTVIAGTADDAVTTTEGDDLVLGDEGTATYKSGETNLDSLVTTKVDTGAGADTITVGDGANTVIAGGNDDTVDSGSGLDLILGDEGDVDYQSASDNPASVTSTDTTESSGEDVIGSGAEDDIVVAGGADDGVTTGDDDDIVAADDGVLTYPAPYDADTYTLERSYIGEAPGLDSIDTGASATATGSDQDVVIAGAKSDEVSSGADVDVILGDEGEVEYDNGLLVLAMSTTTGNVADDGDDITSGSGDDLVIAGNGVDVIDAGSDEDEVAGDNAVYDVTVNRPLDFMSMDSANTAGGAGDDIAGGLGTDWIMGQHGSDDIYGAEFPANAGSAPAESTTDGDDIIIGGHNVAIGRDTVDTIYGDGGRDVVMGDNATARPAHERTDDPPGPQVNLLDVQTDWSALSLIGLQPTVPSYAYGNDAVFGDGDRDRIFGQGGRDEIHGGAEDDYIEGNHDVDTIYGDAGDDDIIGGGSANDGEIRYDSASGGQLDEGDHLFGDSDDEGATGTGDGQDVILGDNGNIDRKLAADGSDVQLDQDLHTDHPLRDVWMVPAVPGVTSGSDEIRGNGGNDEIYGQGDSTGEGSGGEGPLVEGCYTGVDVSTKGDVLCGDAGQDALLGDSGVVRVATAESQGANHNFNVLSSSPFIDERIHTAGELFYVMTEVDAGAGGNDLIFGGGHRDSIHAGAGNDMANADAGNDAVFGGLGNDDLWGGTGHDRIYGGHGMDEMDVKPVATAITGKTPVPASPADWFLVAPEVDRDGTESTSNDGDLIYGGWDADIMQADTGDAGTVAGDRMIDWSGSYNLFYVCNGAYGAGRVQREFSPAFSANLQTLATADGSTSVAAANSSSLDELGLVNNTYVKENTKPRHPLWPGNFTCS